MMSSASSAHCHERDEIVMKRKACNGFTLVELLQVIAIIGILFGLTLTAVKFAMESARKKKTVALVKTMASGFRMYRYEYEQWPSEDFYDDTDWHEYTLVELRDFIDNNNPKKIRFINWGDYTSQGDQVVDAWNGVVRFYINFGDDVVKVASPGEDGIPDNGDDVWSGNF